MKLFFLFLAALFTTYLSADMAERYNSPILEARVSYFLPLSHTLRQLSRNGGVDYGLETTVPVWNGLNIWGGLNYFSRGGSMIGIDRSVHIMMIPITLGLKYIYFWNQYFGSYAGAAGKYYFVEMINRVYPMYRTTHRNGLGGVFEIGFLISPYRHFMIDLFASCSLKTVQGPHNLPPNASSFHLQVGGWNFGGGLGYKF